MTFRHEKYIIKLREVVNHHLPRGVGVSICGFHPQDPGSIPGVGRDILLI